MTTKCFQSLQGTALRVTKLDSCCNPVKGSCSTVVSESFITITLAAQLEAADEFIVKLANGTLCLNEVGCASLKRYDVTVTLCVADPDLFEIIGGVNKVLDFSGNVVGYGVDQDLGDCGNFSLEFWSKVPRDACVSGEPTEYLYWLAPCLTSGKVGDVSIANGPLTFSWDAQAIPSSVWGKGPYNVVAQDATLTAANIPANPGPLLAALPSKTALQVQITTVPPPVEVCGCQALT